MSRLWATSPRRFANHNLFEHDPSGLHCKSGKAFVNAAQQSTYTFGFFLAATAFGCLIATVLVNDRKRNLAIVAGAVGFFASLLFGGSALRDDQLGRLIIYVLVGVAVAICVALVLRLAYRFRVIKTLAGWADRARSAMAPRLWVAAASKPQLGARDLTKRIFVAVSAATGSVAAALIALFPDVFGNALRELHTTHGVLETILLFIVSVALIAPLQEFVLDQAVARRGQHGKETYPSVLDAFWEQVSLRPLRTLTRLVLILILMLMIDLIYHTLDDTVRQSLHNTVHQSLDGTLRSKASLASSQIVLAAMTPAVVSYYWSAALQLKTPSVRVSATWPSVVMSAALSYGLAFAGVLVWFLLNAITRINNLPSVPQGEDLYNSAGAVLGVIFSPLIAVPIALAVSWLGCGIYALTAGYALDRSRDRYPMVAVLIGLLLAAAVHQGVIDLLLWLSGIGFSSWMEGTYLFFATLGWYVGLWASGFPWLLQKPEPAVA
jgi:hypothetical protein